MIGIIGAMDVEIDALKKIVTSPKTKALAGVDYVCGEIEGVKVCIAKCNPGKVNAALCTQLMLDSFEIDCIINIGVGCSLSDEVVIKSVVIASEVCEYDIDITALGEPRGFINGLDRVKIQTDKAISAALAEAASSCGSTVHSGCIASGDTFIASNELKKMLKQEFSAVCGEMEGGAIGHTCAANGVPFAVLRSISDGGDDSAQLDYPVFKEIAAEISGSIILKYLKSVK